MRVHSSTDMSLHHGSVLYWNANASCAQWFALLTHVTQ